METETGMKMLYQALSCGQEQVMVAHGQVERIKQRLLQRQDLPVTVGTRRDSGLSLADRACPSDSITQEEQQAVALMEQETLRERASTYFKKQLAALIKLPMQQIDPQAPLIDYGFDSILAVRFTSALEDTFGPLSKTLLFEYPTLHSMTEYFLRSYPEQLRSVLRINEAKDQVIPRTTRTGAVGIVRGSDPIPATPAPTVPDHKLHTDYARHRLALLPTDAPASDGHAQPDQAVGVVPCADPGLCSDPEQGSSEGSTPRGDIAIIGLAGRYPGARDLRAFWENLRNGRDCITEIPPERWDHRLYFDTDKNKPGKTCSKWGGFLEGVDEFDPFFFNISPREAGIMDPQERLFLECVYATLEDAGYTREGLSTYQSNGLPSNVGVFAGVMYEDYQLFGAVAQAQGRPIALSGSPSSIANRVSYFCNGGHHVLIFSNRHSSSLSKYPAR